MCDNVGAFVAVPLCEGCMRGSTADHTKREGKKTNTLIWTLIILLDP